MSMGKISTLNATSTHRLLFSVFCVFKNHTCWCKQLVSNSKSRWATSCEEKKTNEEKSGLATGKEYKPGEQQPLCVSPRCHLGCAVPHTSISSPTKVCSPTPSLTWVTGILNPGSRLCQAGLFWTETNCSPLLWVLHLSHCKLGHFSVAWLSFCPFQSHFPS